MLASHPAIVPADELIAVLDSKSRRDAVNIMKKLAREYGSTILLVIHKNRIVQLEDAKLASNSIDTSIRSRL